MTIKQLGGVFGRNPTFNNVTIDGELIINGSVFTGLDYEGAWNAATNTPTLTSSVGTLGQFYIVSVAGATDLNGITNWDVGDWALFNGSVWQRVEGGANGNFSTLSVSGLATFNGNAQFPDNSKAIFGDGSDLQVYHDGGTGDSIIAESGAGNLFIRGANTFIQNPTGSSTYIRGIDGGAVDIRYAGVIKLATTATGIDVTGIADASTLFRFGADNSEIANNYLRFKSSGTGFFDHNTVGQAFNFRVSASSALDTIPLVVNSTGINVTGTVTADGLTVSNLDGSIVKLESTGTGLGAGAVIGDLQFYGNDASTPGAGIKASITATTVTALGDDSQLMFSTSNGTTNNVNRMLLANNGDVSFYEDTGTTPKMVWSSSDESLGIGESAPSSKLVVGGNGASTLKPTVQITDGNNGASLALRGKSPILFLDATAGGVPKILMDSQGVEFKDGTIDSEGNVAVKIDSSNNLLVGKTTADLGVTAGIELNGQYDVGYFTRSAEKALVVNRLGTGGTERGTVVEIRSNGTTVGSIGTAASGNIFYKGGASRAGVEFG